MDTLGVGICKAISSFLFSYGITLLYLGRTSGYRDDLLGSPMTIMPQLLKGAIYNLLSGSDGIARSTKQLVMQEALLTILC